MNTGYWPSNYWDIHYWAENYWPDRYVGLIKVFVISFREGDFDQDIYRYDGNSSSLAVDFKQEIL